MKKLIILFIIIVGCNNDDTKDYKYFVSLTQKYFNEEKYDDATITINVAEYYWKEKNKDKSNDIQYWKARIMAANELKKLPEISNSEIHNYQNKSYFSQKDIYNYILASKPEISDTDMILKKYKILLDYQELIIDDKKLTNEIKRLEKILGIRN